jgi:hypothetical protein
MMSIARMSRTLTKVFEHDAVELARQAGLRQRSMSFTQLAYLLVWAGGSGCKPVPVGWRALQAAWD